MNTAVAVSAGSGAWLHVTVIVAAVPDATAAVTVREFPSPPVDAEPGSAEAVHEAVPGETSKLPGTLTVASPRAWASPKPLITIADGASHAMLILAV